MDKATLIKIITKIFNMDLSELNNYAVTVSMSDVDSKAKKFLYKAIDVRRKELTEDTIGVMVVSSDIDTDAY